MNVRGHWTVVREVISSTTAGADVMSALPGLVRRLLDEEAWREFDAPPPTGHRKYESFREFVYAPPPGGLGGRTAQLEALCGDDKDLHKRLRRKLAEGTPPARDRGGDRRSTEFQMSATHLKENTADHIVSRLKKKAPELAERVVSGDLSADAAARQAGIRKPRIVLTSPESIARKLREHLGPDDMATLIRLLLDHGDEGR